MKRLTPGASPISVAQNKGGGQTNRSNSFTLGGVYNNGHFTVTYTVAPNIDALNKVQSHSDLAEFAGVAGGVINIAPRAGPTSCTAASTSYCAMTHSTPADSSPRPSRRCGSYEGYRQVNASSQLALVPTAESSRRYSPARNSAR
jgi:hypothetical protein